jgi:xanthine dehydrogenase accessory factor
MRLDIRDLALRWLAQGRAAVVVEVRAAKGSVPREVGTRMLVGMDEVLGTIGGGHLELNAIRDARALLASSQHEAVQHIALGPSLGQCCGGALDLRFARLVNSDPQNWPQDNALFHLQLYGAGHVGRAIVKVLAEVNCQVQWIDERDSEFPEETLPAHVQQVCVDAVETEVALAPPGAFYLVLTHSHDLDLAISQAILLRNDFGYFGLIGSQSKRARFERRLAERGVHADSIVRMVCPIGVSGIAGKQPEVVAIGVVAQMLQFASKP